MATAGTAARGTHTVTNQAEPLEGYNVFEADRPLVDAVQREGAAWATARIAAVGELAGRADTIRLGFEANENPPRLRTHDQHGRRIDEVEFHPAWHELLGLGVRHGLHALPWRERQSGAHVARAAMFISLAQAEAGIGCPLSMTYSVVPALRAQPELAAEWEERFLSYDYDASVLPATEKAGALAGMAMTEKQGGSDVRANTTFARPIGGGGPGGEDEITGHKWFCSAPMCDAFLVLAQAEGGLSCFLLPRWKPDGERNGFHLQRLKDKLGNRSNASSEVEFESAWARLVGEEGRGVPTIIEMVSHTRLDCVLGSTAGMRAGVAAAINHATQRTAFGSALVDQPLMRNVLGDLAVESEAATVSAMWLARQFDQSVDTGSDPAAGRADDEAPLQRLATPILKYWTCKRAPAHAVESLECLGGNGYVEESGMPRLFRESPLQSIWEGSGNVQALDGLRAMASSPAAVEALFAELRSAEGAERRLDDFVDSLERDLSEPDELEARARRIAESMALALQGSLLVRFGDQAAADAFCASRLDGDWGEAFGTLPAGTDFKRIIARHSPVS